MFDDDGDKLIAIYQVTFCAGAPVLDVTIIMTQNRLNSDLAFTVASDAKQYVVNDLALSVATNYARAGYDTPMAWISNIALSLRQLILQHLLDSTDVV